VRIRQALIVAAAAFVCVPTATRAQFDTPQAGPGKGVRFGDESVHRYQAGVIVEAVNGPCRGLFITVPVPTPWPEQEVKVVDEDFSPAVRRVRYRSTTPGVKQMLVDIPSITAGQTVKALVTYEVRRRAILPPQDTTIFKIPNRLDAQLRQYLATGIYIETRSSRIRLLTNRITADKATAWEQVEAIYNYVRDNVEHRTSTTRKGAVAALRDGHAGNHDLTALFVALCRARRVPARTVWVCDHCYAEFYLHDDEAKGHWFPCQVAGTLQFGQNGTLRTIMQKGDNFQVPEKRERLPYVREFVKGQKGAGSVRPRVTFVRETLDAA
jgi:hypothetical protein